MVHTLIRVMFSHSEDYANCHTKHADKYTVVMYQRLILTPCFTYYTYCNKG